MRYIFTENKVKNKMEGEEFNQTWSWILFDV